MKKKFLNILSVIGIMFVVILISGCELPAPQTKNSLSVPTNVVFDEENYTLSWDEVLNATTYSIYLYKENKCIDTFEAAPGICLSFLEPGVYQASVRAVGDLEIYTPSQLSKKVLFEIKEIDEANKIKLTTPKNVEISYNSETYQLQVVFDNSADYVYASGYQVYLYESDELIKIFALEKSGGYVSLEDINVGTYYVTVAVLTNSALHIGSDESTEVVELKIEKDSSQVGITLSGYYESASNLIEGELEDALRAIITSTHSYKTTYSDCKYNLPNTDEDLNNNMNMILFYTGESIQKSYDLNNDWNREHVWCQSLGWFSTSGAGSDLHHIRPCDISVNSSRGNKKYGTLRGMYEPTDDYKGDVARIIFYLLVRYEESDKYGVTAIAESMELLLKWNELDPVDALEIARNEKIYDIQGNRNPFIDCSDLANYIWDYE